LRRIYLSLTAISIPPASGTPTHLLVMLHGWGADASDLAPLATVLNLPNYQFIFPSAPFPHPEVPGGKAWYALETPNYNGLEESQQMLSDWLRSLEASTGVPLSRTILSGFSQGGAMTLDVGSSLPLAGLCSLSGYLHAKPHNGDYPLPPVLIIHGTQDTVVPLKAAWQARDTFIALGAKVEYRDFEMGHEITSDAIEVLQAFIEKTSLFSDES
jgi:phospholipase/carboxylesterase